MGMDPEQYYTAFVLGNSEDCAANPACLRRAFNAAVSAFHLADHYFEYNNRHAPQLVAAYADRSAFLRHIEKVTNGAFKDIRSIANAYKHLYEDRKAGKPANWTVSSGGSLESVQFEGRSRPVQSVEAEFAEAADPDYRVIYRRRDGTHGEFLPTLEQVNDYWQKLLWGSDA
jgi:hypothetical protein